MRPKKIRQNSLSLILDFDRLNGILMAYIYFCNLNLIAEGILILCMSLFYTKWRKCNFFDEFWAILYDTLFYSIHFRSIFFRHFVFFWKITSLENITEFQNKCNWLKMYHFLLWSSLLKTINLTHPFSKGHNSVMSKCILLKILSPM